MSHSLPQPGAVEIREFVSEGGMGEVRRGLQRSLQRDVAVKKLPDESSSEVAERRLLAEAKLTGGLEHPAIVPVHGVEVDDEGRPLMVMKLLDGQPWSALMASNTPAARHVEVIIKLCHALEFTHDRGFVHRDIKPDNVIVGAFGEVTLIDFGIGARLADVIEPGPVVGTPAYMAPEMVLGEASEASDIFLLGACLYEALAHAPPHDAPTSKKALLRALSQKPYPFPPDAPEELRAICECALAFEESDRYPSVAALREALEAWQKHRSAMRAARQGSQVLSGLRNDQDIIEPVEVHRRYATARAAFDQALSEWPECEAAERGRAELLAWMGRFEADRGSLRHAQALHAELAAPPPDFTAALDARQEREQQQHAAAAALQEREIQAAVAGPGRTATALFNGIITAAVIAGMGTADRTGVLPFSHALAGILTVVGGTASWLTVRFFARYLLNTRMFRESMYSLLALHVLVAVNHFVAMLTHLDAHTTLWLDAILALLIAMIGARALNPLYFVSVVWAGLCVLTMPLYPGWSLELLAAGYLANATCMAWAFRKS